MAETIINSEDSVLLIVDSQWKNTLAKVSLVGPPVPVSDWLGANGPLQRFEIIEGMDVLREVWADQEEVLLLTKFGQRKIRITTYPTEGETRGYLDYTGDLRPFSDPRVSSKRSVQRGLAFIQSLLGT